MYVTLYIILTTFLPLLLPVNLNVFVLHSCLFLLFSPFYVIYCVTHIIGPNVGRTDNKAAERDMLFSGKEQDCLPTGGQHVYTGVVP